MPLGMKLLSLKDNQNAECRETNSSKTMRRGFPQS